MQLNPHYDDVALDAYDQLEERVMACVEAGIPRSHIAIDPGIGFGKTFRHNLELLNQLTLFHGLGVACLWAAQGLLWSADGREECRKPGSWSRLAGRYRRP